MDEVEEDFDEDVAKIAQVRFRDLIKDPVYKAWFLKKPVIHTFTGEKFDPKWRVYIQREPNGSWSYKDVKKYKRGVQVIRWALKQGYHDMALISRIEAFRPPVVNAGGKRRYHRIVPDGHAWCSYCRRPTRFGYFRKHHVFGKQMFTPHEKRCTICGNRLVMVKPYPAAEIRG